jgi:tRNA modification GTPase
VKPAPDRIAAIATAPGRGGIGVVRVSGPKLADLAKDLTGKSPTPRQAHFTKFLDGNGLAIDAGLMLFFPAPHSYTGEDVLELQGHGGPVVMQLLLGRCVELGARLARPGEFTERAFLNDKLDLAQAEAVADLIDADTAAAARSALRSLDGEFSRLIHAWCDKLIDLRMLVEATLDFPEEEIDFLKAAKAFERLDVLKGDLDALLAQAKQGSLLRTGLHVVLAGQPNVGKSSLLNRLSGEDRAIVTEVAGTTRDVLRETIQIEGIPLHIIDTAGLRYTEDHVEKIGIARTWKEIERADLILRLVDARSGVTTSDHEIDSRLPSDVPVIWVFNKIDLAERGAAREETAAGIEIHLSALSGAGIELLRKELLRVAGWEAHGEQVFLARERHLEALREARAHLLGAIAQADDGILDLMAEELRLAQEAINRITGAFTADDLLGVIFSRFCIGK